ncbi:D-amino acid dehydrogenase small subunit [Bordetella ansorpii]|uniref:D-amino acid dehydrogenase small subunit n=1 Tax=Bordetella ansorpii TaxID=288768 RepID=A0A157SH74_9BORD|nr:D-amino acid dehydrogenase [Bordetella ansorpii]SAI69533.1 D-amino acid dehydrogenase small subunit [Bordetella ansorpii]
MAHIAVLGAGITGVTTAYLLNQAGYDVTVVERRAYAAMETSYANGGQLSASNAEVWNQPATLLKGLRWMFQADAPLLLNPAPSWHKYSWLAEFLWAIRKYRDNTVLTTQLAIEARRHLFAMAEQEGVEFDLEKRGILHFYHDRKSFAAARKSNVLLQQGGLERHEVTADEIRRIEPALTGRYYGGFYTRSDATGDIHKFTRGLARATERKGARFLYGREVRGLDFAQGGVRIDMSEPESGGRDRESLHADAIVICGGVGSRGLAAMAGDRINVYPVKGYSITVHLDDEASVQGAPWTSLLDEKAKIVTSRLGRDRFRVAGTAEFNGENRDIRADRIDPLVRWTRANFSMNTSRVVPWAGLRPMMPDMMPRIRRGRRGGVYYNTGHGHLGWTLSGVTATQVVGLIDADMRP